jgi:hypothetical protein
MGWQVLFARHGEDLRMLLRSRGTAALPVELAGSATAEGSRTRVRASAGALRFEGVIDGDVLQGTLRSNAQSAVVRAKRGVETAADLTAPLGAEVAGHRFDVAWEQRGGRVKATVRDASRSHVLEGTLRDGRFDLAGDGIAWRGVIAGASVGLGESIENGKSRALVIDLLHADVPAPHPLAGGASVAPLERWSRGGAGCPSSYDILPQVDGLPALNPMLAPHATTTKCTDAGDLAFIGSIWSTSTYAVTASGSGWFAMRTHLYQYLGGAHGMSGEACQVVSLAPGKTARLQMELDPASLAKLGGLVRKAILAGAPGKSLVDLGFNADDPNVTSDRVMCAVMDHGALALEVVYQNGMDPAGNFRFTDVRPRIPAAKVRALFPAGSIGALVFQ